MRPIHRNHVHWSGRSVVPAWRIRNVHERLYPNTAREQIGQLLAALGSPSDTLWPGADWSPMVLDGVLSEGVSGGHGNVRYTCTTYLPGQLIEFTFDGVHGQPVDGRHVFEVIARRSGVLVRHTLDLECDLGQWVKLALLVVPAHNAVLEQLLDNLEYALTAQVTNPHRWNLHVRLIRRIVGLPATTQQRGAPG
ncbi:hypothetical protein P5V95_15940 [Mycobacteroides abscessus subsp. abscessus]|uniref:SRPBCC family protein n=1 Tax=Mycobacteroides abscessus TaxID=36809 RepID=UPI0012FFEFA5|nr:SRPBCC family protein [Mycobacteroides abscessus]MBN7388529.1 SRPBCC family protein [Mycobacteroides abscessus subsp. abscessus]MBN7414799.1 SRPBCC family protein [Mycobacteroides abscessus subsp. abscessus]MDO2961050.1 hypothetical protein [Mycobacteroides abscessus subsp. abscessus]MDO2995018.1 hypothetical protein [Mycobacteroides abscessus subsp. abscessus]MDO3064329.1 hypothetical protein [Mycobacteroides abscessus subsp. abscessus]